MFNIDVDAKSMTKIAQSDIRKFRGYVEHIAKQKIDEKFSGLPENEYGVAAIIFRPQGANMSRFSYSESATDPVVKGKNTFGLIYWLVEGENHELFLIDNTINTYKRIILANNKSALFLRRIIWIFEETWWRNL